MVRTRALQIRLTRDEYQRLYTLAHDHGYPSLAAYVRHATLGQDTTLTDLLHDLAHYLHTHPTAKERPSMRPLQRPAPPAPHTHEEQEPQPPIA
jgi:hypothetical protein